MDNTDLHTPETLPLLQSATDSSPNIADPETDEYEHSYTSLKDLIIRSSSFSIFPRHSSMNPDDFDPSKILIRNRLVKSAASAYLQSAAILINRDQGWFLNLWGKVRNNVGTSCSCCNVYIREPLKACFRPIYRFFAYTLGGAWGRIFGC
ncbi:hypothetical protein HRI_000966100 [Hibiscus trionum]|uniref:Uncharacterized protein n=1 Tax=Hibiscus trionum TaxID=183268 RepID=A0A9W7H9Q1_HIBTR|nr:hypothetical protein HRI_000966100 [Hibiscus trionum]